ncbi:unnamed protein product [Hermetia illucens]|uniref:Chitin-binding type-2 domain-containing protein n=1 Tax=Hermetia illucens TaxID=343691 RepID=A0A7R8UH88_HERIL|nr:uncharacterized protein LOC119648282 [Hermetia illucens]CAD7080584.1 unnamed protein product [Hermetia illucens]
MRLGIIFRLLIPTAGILLGWNVNHVHAAECEGRDLYVPYPFPGNAKKYKVCFSETGDFKDYDCPPSLRFNEETRRCMAYPGGNPIGECTKEGDKFEVIPADDKCLQYFECNDAGGFGMDSCKDGDEFFNPLLGECVPKAEYYCDGDFPDCSKSNFQNRKWVDKESCESYYECKGDIIVSLKCPSGMFFDAQTQSCLYNTKDACKVPTPKSDLNIETMCKGKVGKFLPDPNYCKAYYYCVDESTPYWSPCANDRYFEKETCTQTRASSCICEDLTWGESDSPVNVPHPDKTKFYVCEKERQAVEKSCPPGTTFNATKKMCAA